MSSLASIPPFLLITEDKGGPTHGHKTKSWFCSMEVGNSCFTIFGKNVSGYRKYIEPLHECSRSWTEIPIILLLLNLGYTTSL